jgi:putative aminopeptidase FrvX
MNVRKIIKRLSQAPGPTGNEFAAAEITSKIWEPYVDDIEIDRLGSVIARVKGVNSQSPRRILLAAHLDEIGLMVKKIVANNDPNNSYGFLRLTKLGGVDIRHLYGQAVKVHGSGDGSQELVGVIGSLPARMLPPSRRKKAFGFDDLVVDVGLPLADVERLVRVGDFISFRQPVRRLLNGRITGKALDNRASIAALAVCLSELSSRRHQWDVVVMATAQEETSFLGAYTGGHTVVPDIAIAVDVTVAKGPGNTDASVIALGAGPIIGIGPNIHPGVLAKLKQVALTIDLTVHLEPHTRSSGTDAYALQIVRDGIPTGVVSIPLRNMHSMVEIAAIRDVKRTGRFLAEFVTRLDSDFYDRLDQSYFIE